MSTQAPAWRKRTRPCPFYSQGRCLFADSCNFLHDIKVKNVVDQPVFEATYAKPQIPTPSENVLDPPSLIVHSPSSPSANFSSPTCDSSRYSGLLSVLQDVIGPNIVVQGKSVPTNEHEGPDGPAFDLQDSICIDNTLPQGSDKSFVDSRSSHLDTDRCILSPLICSTVETGNAGNINEVHEVVQSPYDGRSPSSHNLTLDQERTSWCSTAEDGPTTACTSYLVEEDVCADEGSGFSILGDEMHGAAGQDVEHVEDGESAVAISRRDSHATSILSTFSGDGASLLASPLDNPMRRFPSTRPTDSSSPDILSPVQLSAKLRPFSIPSLDTSSKRGDSIDSGYADGESWINPFPFSRTPPRNVRLSISSVTFHPRRLSLVSPTMQERMVSYDVRPIRPSPSIAIEVIEENMSSPTSAEGEDDDACSIFGAYDLSPSESQQDLEIDCSFPTVRVSTVQTAEDLLATEDEITATVPPALRFSMIQRDHSVGTSSTATGGEQHSVSGGDISCNTALSTQRSADDSSDDISPVRQDSLLSPISSRSSSNTSLLSPDSYAPKSLGEGNDRPSLYDTVDLADMASSASLENPVGRKEDISNAASLTTLALSPASSLDAAELGHIPLGAAETHQLKAVRTDPVEDVWSGELNIYGGPLGDDAQLDARTQEGRGAEENSSSQGDSNSSDCYRFFAGSPLQFPLPPTHLPTDLVSDIKLCTHETTFVSPIVQDPDAQDNLTRQQVALPRTSYNSTRKRAGSGLRTRAEADTSLVSHTGGLCSRADFSSRARAASDTTVKGLPPCSTCPVEDFANPEPPTDEAGHISQDESGRSDFMQSLYDHYLDDGPSDNGSRSSGSGNEDHFPMFSPVTREHTEARRADSGAGVCQSPDPAKTVRPMPTASVPVDSPADLSKACTVLRPLLTGRRSILDPSFPVNFIPQLSSEDRSPSLSSRTSSVRLQTKEIGSTMVPFGFQRYNAQFAARRLSQSIVQPPYSAPPQTDSREALSMQTDVMEGGSPSRYSSALPASLRARWMPPESEPKQSQFVPQSGGLRPLRLSAVLNRSPALSSSSSITSSIVSPDHILYPFTPQSPTVSSSSSLSRNSLLSSSCHPLIPEHTCNTLLSSGRDSPVSQSSEHTRFPSQLQFSRRDSRSISVPLQQSGSWRLSRYREGSRGYNPADANRRMSTTSVFSLPYVQDEEEPEDDDPTVLHPRSSNDGGHSARRPASTLVEPFHAIATPKPTLLFAIASDDVDRVRQVLESGEAGPNDLVGPQSALAFTLTNDKLAHKNDIVKALLAYGADPSALRNSALNPSLRVSLDENPVDPPPETTLEGMDPATRYFVARADGPHTRQTSQLMYRSFFRPLTRVRYDVIGQDWALEQLFRVLSMHSHQLAVSPIVVLLCGPSGHGKSLLARKFGSLLGIPTHTVNMTTLRSSHDIWQSFSMSPYEEPSSCTLAQFLLDNEGKRCVVVLDEIEKTEDQRALWSLLMPWELGRCSLEVGKRNIDVRNVVWLGTSNIGHDLVFEHHESRPHPQERMTREEYQELTNILRPRVSHCLGASLLSRVTAVLPFVPFTQDEKKAIAAEAVYMLAGDSAATMTPHDVESLVMRALPSYCPGEGARSLHRAISNQLMDDI